MIVLDGLGDRPSTELGNRTPLEAAETPILNELAMRGSTGLGHSILPWVPVGTQTGLGMLMGLARSDLPNLTRGPIEAAGAGLATRKGDIAFRCNLATLTPNGTGFAIDDRRAGRISEGVHELLSELDGIQLSSGVSLKLAPSTHHRAVAVLRGDGLSPSVSDTDPGAGNEANGVLTCHPLNAEEPAARTAKAINKFVRLSFDRLNKHPVNLRREQEGLPPANGLITRGAGAVAEYRSLLNHLGLSTAVVTGEGTAVGLSRLFGFTTITDPAFNALTNTDVDGKVRAALAALENHDLVFLHVKGPDVAAHDHDPEGKRDMIERIDRALAPILEREIVICVTADHSTDSNSGRHTGDPVPTLLCGPNGRQDDTSEFSESACERGGLGRLPGTSILCACLDLMNVMHNHRAYELFFYS
jgi:2,3-bisphosphoglycerate-independent phosphoglycerate mutase